MKHAKKRKRQRRSKEVHVQNSACGRDDEERRVLSSLLEAFASVSLEEAASAYREANGDSNKAAEILGNLDDAPEEDRTTTCSSSNGSLGSTSGSNLSNFGHFRIGEKVSRSSKPKKVVAATGMVSTVLGKDYVSSNPGREVPKLKGCSDAPANKEVAEQFLYSLLGDECELSIAVVRDVLCQSSYDIEKALNVLLELSASSYELSKSGQYHNFSGNIKEDTQFLLESSDNLTDRGSDSTSHSSESELHDNVWAMGYNGRNYFEVLAGSGAHPASGPRNSSELPQEVLESLFNMPKSSQHEPRTMNWRNVVKKMESLGQRREFCPSEDVDEQQHSHAKGDDYQVFRKTARQHWDSMKSYYQKAATAYANGEREYAAHLSEQGRLSNKMARQADEKASRNIFKSRNKSIENVITIDLHGQHVKQATRLLKLHLLFGAYVRSVRLFRVITGCGSHGVGKSKLKQSVINLIEKEGIEWSEENRGTLLIRLDGQTEFSFLDCESDTE